MEKVIDTEKQAQSPLLKRLGYVGVVVAVAVTVIVSIMLYEHTVNLLTENLRQILLAIVKTAAVQVNTDDLDKLHELDDYKKPEYQRVVKQLIRMRESNNDIIFMYILRKSESDPSKMVFVADSHSLDPFAKIDLDGNGIIDEADALNYPGDLYDDVPKEAFMGYEGPITNKDLYEDQWGVLISGYAPIYRPDGTVAGVMTVDVRADNFFTITRQTLYPFLVFVVTLVLILLVLASGLIHIWNKRILLLAELDRQKDELISIVSHQLATPVTSVKWYIEMMLDGDTGKLAEEQEKQLKTMQGVTTDLVDLVGMLLDVSRIQLGRMKVDRAELKLGDFFSEVLAVIEPKAQVKKQKFITSLPKALPTAMLDKRLMRMTLENLLSNAVKYTPEGGQVELTVTVKDKMLRYEVKDTGCGIPKEEHDKIFGKLFRATNVRDVDGNGLGLFAAKGAVEAQGGKVWFTSESGKGTTFYVEVPIEGAKK